MSAASITKEAVLEARSNVELAKARFLQGDIGYDAFRATAAEYKRLAEARQVELWGKVRMRIDVKSLMR